MNNVVFLPQKPAEMPLLPAKSDPPAQNIAVRQKPANDCSSRAGWRRRLVYALALLLPIWIIRQILNRAPGKER